MENLPVVTLLSSKFSLSKRADLIKEAEHILSTYMNTTLNIPRECLKVRSLTKTDLLPFKADFAENYEGDVSWEEYMIDEGYVQVPGSNPATFGFLKNPVEAFQRFEVGGRFRNTLPIKKGIRSPWIDKPPKGHPMYRSLLRLSDTDWKNLFGEISKPKFATAAKVRQIDLDSSDFVAEAWLGYIYARIQRLIGHFLGETGEEIEKELARIHTDDLNGFFDFDHLKDLVIYADENCRVASAYGETEFKKVYENLFSFAPFALATEDTLYQPDWLDYYGILTWNTKFRELVEGFDPEAILLMCDCGSIRNTKDVFFFHQCLTRPPNMDFLPLIGKELKDNYDAQKKLNKGFQAGP